MQQLLNLVQGISKQQLGDITTLGDEGAFALDNSDKLLFLTRQAEDLLGWKTKELLQQNFLTRVNFTLDSIASIGAASCSALKSVGCAHLQKGAVVTTRSGQILQIMFITVPIFDRGRVMGKVFVFSENKNNKDPSGVCEQVVNSCSAVLLKLDLKASVVFCNNFTQHRFGENIKNMVPAEVRLTLQENPERLLIPITTVSRCKDVHDQVLCIAWSVNAVRDNNGNVVGALCVGTDISDIDAREGALTPDVGLAQSVFHVLQEAVLSIDLKGSVEYLNLAAECLTGFSSRDARGLFLKDVLYLVDVDNHSLSIPIPLHHHSVDSTADKASGLLRRRDGKEFRVNARISSVIDAQGRQTGSVIVCNNVSESIKDKAWLLYDDKRDVVTGLITRVEFEKKLAQALQNASDNGRQHALCVVKCDCLNIFDDALKQISALISQEVSISDIVARIDEAEFAVLLHNCSLQTAQDSAAKICTSIGEFTFIANKKAIKVDVNIGLIPMTSASGGLADVLRIVDTACYVAKQKGPDRLHVYDVQELSSRDRQSELGWMHKIRQSLLHNQFRLYTQVIVPLNKKTVGLPHYEVLLRMLDDAGDLIRPGAFLPTAARFGLMPSIDRWVIRKTLNILEQRLKKGEPTGIYAINLSAQSLDDDNFLRFVIDQLDETSFPVDNICFEITESSALSNLMSATRFMSTVRGMGCRFSLDDFGRGFSSYAYLKNLPLDFLKIDGSFIRELSNDPINLAMVQSINQIGHILGVQTIAECVENDDAMDKLTSIGVDHAQGYQSGKPTPMQCNISLVKQLHAVD